ncbi:MAG: hypothetical protein IJI45_11615 [Anaerolineaceae bacterium]|nr:hypothetical protein [Anaerolineaceae bacterium]
MEYQTDLHCRLMETKKKIMYMKITGKGSFSICSLSSVFNVTVSGLFPTLSYFDKLSNKS